jgi:hypothetical protein
VVVVVVAQELLAALELYQAQVAQGAAGNHPVFQDQLLHMAVAVVAEPKVMPVTVEQAVVAVVAQGQDLVVMVVLITPEVEVVEAAVLVLLAD